MTWETVGVGVVVVAASIECGVSLVSWLFRPGRPVSAWPVVAFFGLSSLFALAVVALLMWLDYL